MSPPKRIAYIVAAFFLASIFFSWLLTRGTRAPERPAPEQPGNSNANNSNSAAVSAEPGSSLEDAGARRGSASYAPRAGEARIILAAAAERRPVKTLRPEDVRVTDGNETQRNVTLEPDPDLPLSLAVIVDVSDSQKNVLPRERAAVSSFLGEVVRPDRDSASVISFSNETRLEQNLTSDVGEARAGLSRVRVVGAERNNGGRANRNSQRANDDAAPAAIWDALWFACDQVLESSPTGARRAILILTDGEDSGSRRKMSEVVERALRSDVAVYSIGMGDESRVRRNEETLRKLSDETGGLSFFPKTDEELRDALSQIQRILRAQFVLTYTPTDNQPDDSFHRVRVEVINPELRRQRVRVVHRHGYYAGGLAYPSQNK